MENSNTYYFPVFFLLILFIAVLHTACNTVDTDYERDNPVDPLLPHVEILHPGNSAITHPGDSLLVEIQAQGTSGSPEELEISISSSVDGDLGTISPNSTGFASVKLGNLSNNIHYIRAEVVNRLGDSYADSIQIFNNAAPAVDIIEAKLVNSYYTEIEWERSNDPNFSSYELFRTNTHGNIISLGKFTDIESTTFQYVAPMDSLNTYFVDASSSFYESVNRGNSKSVYRPLVQEFASNNPLTVTKYPGYPILLIGQNSFQFGDLTALNYIENTVIGKIATGRLFNDLAVGDNGFGPEIYAVNSTNQRQLRIYDGLSMELKETIDAGYRIDGIETDNRGNIITLGFNSFRASKRNAFPATNSHIEVTSGDFKISDSSNDIFLIRNTYRMWHLSYDDESNVFGLTVWPHEFWPLMSGGNFNVHPHGDYVVTAAIGNILTKPPQFAFLKTLNPDGQYAHFAFDESGDFLFALDQRGWIDIYEDLTFKEALEVGIDINPRNIFYDNGQIILFGESTVLANYYGVVVLPETILDL